MWCSFILSLIIIIIVGISVPWPIRFRWAKLPSEIADNVSLYIGQDLRTKHIITAIVFFFSSFLSIILIAILDSARAFEIYPLCPTRLTLTQFFFIPEEHWQKLHLMRQSQWSAVIKMFDWCQWVCGDWPVVVHTSLQKLTKPSNATQ